MKTATVIKCLDSSFALCDTAGYVHPDQGPSLMFEELHTYLLSRGITSSHSAAYNPRENGKVERFVETIVKSMPLSLKTHKLPTSEWEQVMPEALHSKRSLINATTTETSHQRFFGFSRRSTCGTSTPTWLKPGNQYLSAIDKVKQIH